MKDSAITTTRAILGVGAILFFMAALAKMSLVLLVTSAILMTIDKTIWPNGEIGGIKDDAEKFQ